MTRRQAAPPAHRWLLLFAALLVAPWLGHGVADAASLGVDPQSGRAGTQVNVTLKDFFAACVVLFDDVPITSPIVGCEDTSVTITIPASASVGTHQIRAVGEGGAGEKADQSLPFRVTGAPAPTTPAATAAPSTQPAVDPDTGSVPAGTPTTARSATTPSTGASTPPAGAAAGQTGTTVAGGGSVPGPVPVVFAAGCPPRQVALLRFAVTPTRAKASGKVSAATSWGAVGTCTEVRDLRVLLDGEPVASQPPKAGTPGVFSVTVPAEAEPGDHQFSLVAADDPSFVLATLAFEVEAEPSLPLVIAGVAAGALLVLIVVLLVRRRRRRKRRLRDAGGDDREDPFAVDDSRDPWGGTLDVPDIATPVTAGPPADTGASSGAGAGVGAVAVAGDDDEPTLAVVRLVVTSGRDGSFYLLERQNPHAPRRPNGKRGWYRDARSQPIRGIVLRAVDPHTAGSAASELAMGETPASAHAVVDVDGALGLLPDDLVAIHRPPVDEATLVLLVAGYGGDPGTDEMILGHVAAWAGAKMREYGIPARPVSEEEFLAGAGGLLSDDVLPWHRLVARIEPSQATDTPGTVAPEVSATPTPSVGATPEPPPPVFTPDQPATPAASSAPDQPAPPDSAPPVPDPPVPAPPAPATAVPTGVPVPVPADITPPPPGPTVTEPTVAFASATPAAVDADPSAPEGADPDPMASVAPPPPTPIPSPPPTWQPPWAASLDLSTVGSPDLPDTAARPDLPGTAARPDLPDTAVPTDSPDTAARPTGEPTTGPVLVDEAPTAVPTDAPTDVAAATLAPVAPAPPAPPAGPEVPLPASDVPPHRPVGAEPTPPATTAPAVADTATPLPTPPPAPTPPVPTAPAGADLATPLPTPPPEPTPSATTAPAGADPAPPLPAPPPPAPPAPPVLAAARTRRRSAREKRPLPTPDELIAEVEGSTAYYLLEHENPHGTLRADGRHGWYYPTRYGGIRAVVLHSLGGGDTADAVAAHLAAVEFPEAAHAVVDPDLIVDLLPDDATALHGVRSSSAALDLAVAYYPDEWGTDAAAEEALLVRAATWAGVRAIRHSIPIRRITVDQWHSGQRGLAGHGDVDPGPDFPWGRFLQLTSWVAGRVAANPPPPRPPATGPTETVRSGSPPI